MNEKNEKQDSPLEQQPSPLPPMVTYRILESRECTVEEAHDMYHSVIMPYITSGVQASGFVFLREPENHPFGSKHQKESESHD